MPRNPPRPPTTEQKVKLAEYHARWWIKQHQTILAYVSLGLVCAILLFLVGTSVNSIGLVMTGYLAAGVFVALFQPDDHR